MKLRSDDITKGLARAPHRSLLRALGLGDRELGLPFIGVANSFNEVIPGHLHLRSVAEAVNQGIGTGGGGPFEFGGNRVCGAPSACPGVCRKVPGRLSCQP